MTIRSTSKIPPSDPRRNFSVIRRNPLLAQKPMVTLNSPEKSLGKHNIAEAMTFFKAGIQPFRTLVKEGALQPSQHLVRADAANEQIQAMTFKHPKFRARQKAHKTVIAHERWFRKGEPFLGQPFTVKKTLQRHAAVINILSRATKRAARAGNDQTADAYRRLQAKLTPCRPRRRCGSSACPKCARAFQRAKVDAEQMSIADLAKSRANKHLVFVTIIPRHMTYLPGQFSQINVPWGIGKF